MRIDGCGRVRARSATRRGDLRRSACGAACAVSGPAGLEAVIYALTGISGDGLCFIFIDGSLDLGGLHGSCRPAHAFSTRVSSPTTSGNCDRTGDRRDDSYFDASRSPFFSCMCHVSHLVGHVQASHWRCERGVCCFSYGGALIPVQGPSSGVEFAPVCTPVRCPRCRNENFACEICSTHA